MLQIVLADLDALRVGLEIVIAIGQGEAALTHGGDGFGGILGVRLGAEAEEHGNTQALQGGGFAHDITGIVNGVDVVEDRASRGRGRGD